MGESEIELDRYRIDLDRREAELRKTQSDIDNMRVSKITKSILQGSENSSQSEELFAEQANSQGNQGD